MQPVSCAQGPELCNWLMSPVSPDDADLLWRGLVAGHSDLAERSARFGHGVYGADPMTHTSQKRVSLRAFWCALLVGLTLAGRGWCEARQSAEDLIKFLTYQSGRPGKELLLLAGCGLSGAGREDRRVETELIGLGASAVTPLEAAFDSLQAFGNESPFFPGHSWLMNAYAHIKGASACPRLWRMLSNPKTVSLESDLDSALAVALGLTSYVSDFSGMVSHAQPCEVFEPRDALDNLILACLRAEIRPGKRRGTVALGYRFELPGHWSLPRDRPEGTDAGIAVHTGPGERSLSPEIDTVFKDSSGNDCGKHHIRFFTRPSFIRLYLVDDADLPGLVRLISSCATEPGRGK